MCRAGSVYKYGVWNCLFFCALVVPRNEKSVIDNI